MNNLSGSKWWYTNVKQSVECRACGEARAPALDFHHISDKEDSVSALVGACASIEVVAHEMEKCVVLCANCHRLHHANLLDLDPEQLERGTELSREVVTQGLESFETTETFI